MSRPKTPAEGRVNTGGVRRTHFFVKTSETDAREKSSVGERLVDSHMREGLVSNMKKSKVVTIISDDLFVRVALACVFLLCIESEVFDHGSTSLSFDVQHFETNAVVWSP